MSYGKRIFCVLVLAVFILVGLTHAELLNNGDFSAGPSNWPITDGGVYADLGDNALKVWATGGQWDVGWAQQDVPATPGQTYTLNADVLNPSSEPLPGTGGEAFVKLEFYDGTGTIINGEWGTKIDIINGTAPTDTWIPLSGSMVAPARSVTVRVVPMVQDIGGGVSVAWFDNVSLVGASVPVINDPDFNNDGIVNVVDFADLAGVWGQTSSTYNLAGEELIDIQDLQAFAAAWLRTSPYPGYDLVWSDEFNGSTINTSNWNHETGGGGWGNNELQYYTDRSENSRIENGYLVIEAREENYGGRNYTSARMTTQNKAYWTYGKMEARIKLPYGQGMWPAFWMMPQEYWNPGWPECGEIDIMEAINTMDWVKSSLHYGQYDPQAHDSYGSAQYYLPGGGNFSDDFHIYGMEWEEGIFKFFVDGVQIGSATSWWATYEPWPAPFNRNFFFILNIAVGGNWPGSPNGSTVFPQQMLVDYVRVYQTSP